MGMVMFAVPALQDSATHGHSAFELQMPVSTKYTLTLWDHCPLHEAIHICIDRFTWWPEVIDRFTWWPEVIPLTDITAEMVGRAFTSGWVSRFGVLSTVSTDRGRQFKSTLWTQLMHLLGCKRIHTTPYHPIANGII